MNTQDEQTCAHHWMIEAPEGTISSGRCRRCGAVAEFQNYLVDGFVRTLIPIDTPPVQRAAYTKSDIDYFMSELQAS
jgi:hypothetical protein